MPDDFVREVTDRYIELFEFITGETFYRFDENNRLEEIEKRVREYLE
jgi:phosphoribosylaminoimidazole-succinocarboxamide synthase